MHQEGTVCNEGTKKGEENQQRKVGGSMMQWVKRQAERIIAAR